MATSLSPARPAMQFGTLANSRDTNDYARILPAVLERSLRADAEGWDMLGCADMAIGDPFPLLALIAQHTERVPLMTRVTGSAIRSAPLLASASAWIDRISKGRFTLGLGASTKGVVTGRHGLPFVRPARQMADTIAIIRGLFGQDVAGASRNTVGDLVYQGDVIAVTRGAIDMQPVGRVPIIIAASGPLMLRLAGAYCDGVLVELATPEFVGWAWEQIRHGAAAARRELPADFTFMYQSQIAVYGDLPSERRRIDRLSDFLANHMMQQEFDHMWHGGGLWDVALRVRELFAAEQRAEAIALMEEVVIPRMAITGTPDQLPGSLRGWIESMWQAGVTQMTLPLEMEEVLGVSLAQAKAWAQETAESDAGAVTQGVEA